MIKKATINIKMLCNYETILRAIAITTTDLVSSIEFKPSAQTYIYYEHQTKDITVNRTIVMSVLCNNDVNKTFR